MAKTVRIEVVTGPHKGRRFCFRGPAECTVGRAEDCFLHLSGQSRDQLISRHHCSLTVLAADPPCMRLQDLGSLNGTYLNGSKVEPEGMHLTDLAGDGRGLTICSVRDGDIITVGGTSLRVNIVDCPPAGIDTAAVWKENQLAKRDCLLIAC